MKLKAVALITLVTIAIVALIAWAFYDQAKWEASCRDRGGVVSHTTKRYTHWVDGKPTTGTDTTYYCLTTDGRILEIR